MTWWTILGIAFSLAMDAFAVAIANGVVIRENHLRHALVFGLSFGLFQMAMPVAGWLAGSRLAEMVAPIDHWIVFAILALTGGKMIYESFRLPECERCAFRMSFRLILCLSLATSMDAFAVGMSFALLNVDILWPALITGAVTFLLSFIGVFIGERFGHFFENKVEAFAGVVLIAIGLNVLLTHLFTGRG